MENNVNTHFVQKDKRKIKIKKIVLHLKFTQNIEIFKGSNVDFEPLLRWLRNKNT